MKCRRCGTDNPDGGRSCAACGALLPHRARGRTGRRTDPYLFAALVFVSVAALACVLVFSPGRHRERPSPAAEQAASRPAASAPAASRASAEETAAPAGAVGLFSVGDPAGSFDGTMPGAFFDGGWAALPAWTFLGGSIPRLQTSGRAGTRPAAVDWKTGEPVVLCFFDAEGENAGSLRLAAWNEGAPLEWRPLSGERTVLTVAAGPLGTAGSFRTFGLSGRLEEAGVLLQKGDIVGWTFGSGATRGYLWSPTDRREPERSLDPAALADPMLASCRESALVRAMRYPAGMSVTAKLEAFAAALRLEAAFPPDDLPEHLKPEAIAAEMAGLADALVRSGSASEVTRILDRRTLAAAASLVLARTAVSAALRRGDFSDARRLVADLESVPPFRDQPARRSLDAILTDLAKSGLRAALNERSYRGLDIYEEAAPFAAGDAEFNLLGAEAAVQEKNWARAEEILKTGPYPEALSDRIRTLERLIEEGRRDQESAVIRFDPGDKLITAEALLNGRVRQKFLIDTGATMSIIPVETAKALNIRIDDSTPAVGIQGVAGIGVAYKARVDSIEIEGQKVFDIDILVFDIDPDHPVGILGNNFLEHFQIDLDKIKGVLKLRKK